MGGIVEGAGEAVGDTIDGIVALGKWETWENMGHAVTHLDETLPAMWNTLSDSFINDVINGDAESRAKWGSYVLAQVGLGLIGDKGISKISKVTTLAKGANISKFSQGMSRAASKLNMGDRLAFADISSFKSEIPMFQDFHIKTSSDKNTVLSSASGKGVEHVGQLKGQDITLKDIFEKEVIYTKRNREEAKQLRRQFFSKKKLFEIFG